MFSNSEGCNCSDRWPLQYCSTVLQPLRWCYVDCVIHHERDVREEQKYVYVERASNNKRDCDAWSLLLLAATVRSFAHMPLGISDRISGNKTIPLQIFCTNWIFLEKVQLKLMMSHSQQLFTLHWGDLGVIIITAHTSKRVRWIFPGVREIMDFSMEWPKKKFPGGQQWWNRISSTQN